MFIFVELFRFVGEKIGFEVLVFGPASPDIEPGRCTFLSILVFRISFTSWIYWFQNLEIFQPFLRNSCDEIIWWFGVTIVTVIFTCRYFKSSWNTSALSQSNGRNFSGSSIRNSDTTTVTWAFSPHQEKKTKTISISKNYHWSPTTRTWCG